MELNGKEYTKEFLEQLLMDAVDIADCISLDINEGILNEDNCDIEAYTNFALKYLEL